MWRYMSAEMFLKHASADMLIEKLWWTSALPLRSNAFYQHNPINGAGRYRNPQLGHRTTMHPGLSRMSREELYKRKRYAVFACYRCHQWQYSNMFQKTHKCVKCRKRLMLERVNPALETDDIDEAIEFLQKMKKRDALKKGWSEFVSADKLLR